MKKTITLIFLSILLFTNCLTQPITITVGADPADQPNDTNAAEQEAPVIKTIPLPEYKKMIIGTWYFKNPEMKDFGFRFYTGLKMDIFMTGEILPETYQVNKVNDQLELYMEIDNNKGIFAIFRFIDPDPILLQKNLPTFLAPIEY